MEPLKINFDLLHKIKPRKKAFDHRLGDGLVMNVQPSGTKTIQLKYRYQRRAKTLTIGRINLLSSHEIMDEYYASKRLLLRGICPVGRRKEERNKSLSNEASLAELIDVYCNEHVITLKRPEQSLYIIDKHIRPKLGSVRADKLTLNHVYQLTKSLAPTIARKVAERLNSIINYATGKGIVSITNPLDGKVANFGKKGGKTQRTLSFDDIEHLVNYLSQSGLNRSYQCLTLLLLLTGQRKTEWLEAKWSEINFHKKTFTIDPNRLKTSKSDNDNKSKEHIVHLVPQTITLLEELREKTGGKRKIFADVSPNYYNQALTKATSMINMKHFTPHDLRRTFFSRNVDLNVDVFVIEKILNHKMVGVMAHYNLSEYTEQRIRALNDWADKVITMPKGL